MKLFIWFTGGTSVVSNCAVLYWRILWGSQGNAIKITMLKRKNTRTHTRWFRPPVLKFSQGSPLFCWGKHQGAQREEQTNSKLTHSPVTLCLHCKHKRASVCLCLCVYSQHYSKLQSWEKERNASCGTGLWHRKMATCQFPAVNLPTVRSIQMSAVSLSIPGRSEMLRMQRIGSDDWMRKPHLNAAMFSSFDVIFTLYLTVFVHDIYMRMVLDFENLPTQKCEGLLF